MLSSRSAGIILHPTSLPGPEGMGTLGREARAFADALSRAGQRYWQVLPLGPAGPFDSPYMCTSAVAGNPLLVDLRTLAEAGWLDPEALRPLEALPTDRVDYQRATPLRRRLLDQAAAAFAAGAGAAERAAVDAFRADHASWLADFALFTALSEAHGEPWIDWPAPLRDRDSAALDEARGRLRERIAAIETTQWWFFEQWAALRAHCVDRGVRIMGDMPIFVALHSADVWARPELFHLDDERRPTVVAGVPPDYFSATGQRWGNPLYRWEAHAAEGYAWWCERLRLAESLCDLVRIDHFRGFEAYWEIPASAPTAVDGRWVKGPGEALFEALRGALGDVPVVAEDLGIITPEVEALRDGLGVPGMKVLQFAFGGEADNPYLPHNHVEQSVVYTGTHDNDTTAGWYHSLDEGTADHVRRYLATDGSDIAWTLLRTAWASVAALALAPAQDLLSLGSDRRMNVPGARDGNWAFRLEEPLPEGVLQRLAAVTRLYGR